MKWPLAWRSTLENCQMVAAGRLDRAIESQERLVKAELQLIERAREIGDLGARIRLAEMNLEEARLHDERAEKRYDDLLARYHMLRLQGHVSIAPPEPVKPLDPITAAIASASGGDPELRRMMEAQVVADRIDGKSDAEILTAIHAGQSHTDGTFI